MQTTHTHVHTHTHARFWFPFFGLRIAEKFLLPDASKSRFDPLKRCVYERQLRLRKIWTLNQVSFRSLTGNSLETLTD